MAYYFKWMLIYCQKLMHTCPVNKWCQCNKIKLVFIKSNLFFSTSDEMELSISIIENSHKCRLVILLWWYTKIDNRNSENRQQQYLTTSVSQQLMTNKNRMWKNNTPYSQSLSINICRLCLYPGALCMKIQVHRYQLQCS